MKNGIDERRLTATRRTDNENVFPRRNRMVYDRCMGEASTSGREVIVSAASIQSVRSTGDDSVLLIIGQCEDAPWSEPNGEDGESNDRCYQAFETASI